MPESRQELEQQLAAHQRELAVNDAAIRETRKLLDKADKRLRDNPGEKSKWGRTLNNLEETLIEKKRLFSASQTNIQQIEGKLNETEFSEDGTAVIEPPNNAAKEVAVGEPIIVPDNLSLDDLKKAVQRIVSIHIIKIHGVSDLDFKLAKAFMSSRAAQSLSVTNLSELRKRLSILEKTRGGATRGAVIASKATSEGEAAGPIAESVSPHIIQSALQKCVSKDFDSITLVEIEVLGKYGMALAKQGDSPKKNLIPLIEASLATIEERIRSVQF